jgi:hypothetical protein
VSLSVCDGHETFFGRPCDAVRAGNVRPVGYPTDLLDLDYLHAADALDDHVEAEDTVPHYEEISAADPTRVLFDLFLNRGSALRAQRLSVKSHVQNTKYQL